MPRRAIPPHIRDASTQHSIAQLRAALARAVTDPHGAVVFDAYGTLFDVRSVEAACAVVTTDAAAFAAHWRAKQLEYSWQRTLMGRYADFADRHRRGIGPYQRPFRPPPRRRRQAHAPRRLAGAGTFPRRAGSPGSPVAAPAGDPLQRQPGDARRPPGAQRPRRPLRRHPERRCRRGVQARPARLRARSPAALGQPAEQMLFVTANPWDAIGAKNYGFRVAWCNRAGLAFDTHGPAPDLEVRSLAQLAEALAP